MNFTLESGFLKHFQNVNHPKMGFPICIIKPIYGMKSHS